MSNHEAQKRIEACDGVSLDLRHLGLSSVPDSIANLTNLTTLWLAGNQLSSVPDSIANLTNLTTLGLGGNRFSSVPDSIANLTELWLGGNQLSSVPDSIANLTNLTTLYLNDNQLLTLPPSMPALTGLTSVDMSETEEMFGVVGNLSLGGNRWNSDFRQAADAGIEALWEHLRTQEPPADPIEGEENSGSPG